MLEQEKVAFYLASRLISRGNKGTLLLTVMIIAMVFVNLIFLPSISSLSTTVMGTWSSNPVRISWS